MDESSGYRVEPVGGATLRADVIDVYVFRRAAGEDGIELLQLFRIGAPMDATWQPVMGHVEAGERAWEAGIRECAEEIGLRTSDAAFVGMWALEQVWPYYLAEIDCVVMSPRFAVEVASGWEPALNEEHSAARWISAPHHGGQPASEFFMWPGQKHAVAELLEVIACEGSEARKRLRITPGRS